MSKEKGIKLDIQDVNELATKISGMYDRFNDQRTVALALGQEVRNYVFATNIDTTSSGNISAANRTHIPKLTELSDTLQSNYWESIFGEKDFFVFNGVSEEDKVKAAKVEAWIKVKLEAKKFRQSVGRQLIADFVIYGNCFIEVDFIVELDDYNMETYKGVVFRRVSPLDIVFDAQAESFKDSPKIRRRMIHIADLPELPVKFPSAKYDKKVIAKILKSRQSGVRESWVEMLHEANLEMDGFGSYDAYFKQDFVEVLTYRGDVYDPMTGKVQKNRIVEVVDRIHVIRNEPNPSPAGMSGVHHIGWRVRPDNLWAMGALDNLAGMQYRVNKIENLKADVIDVIGHPIVIHKGGEALDKLGDIYRAGEFIDLGADEELIFERPDANILRYADSHMNTYFSLMEDFAGAPPEERGIRTPGEKTAAEINMIDSKGSKLFRDKARLFEAGLEGALKEAFELTLRRFDGEDYVEIFNDLEGKEILATLSLEDIKARGDFTAMGSKHWDIKNKRKSELAALIGGILQDPSFKAHMNAWEAVKTIEDIYQLQDTHMFERYRGVKDEVELQAIAQAESQQLAGEAQQEAGGQAGGGGQPGAQELLPGQ